MATREEIREGIAKKIRQNTCVVGAYGCLRTDIEASTEAIIKYLHSQGVVIKENK